MSSNDIDSEVPAVRNIVGGASHRAAKLMHLRYYLDDSDLLKLVSASVAMWLADVAERLSLSEPMHPDIPGILCRLWRNSYSYIPVSGMALFLLRLGSGEWELYRKLGSNDVGAAFRKFATEYTAVMVAYNSDTDGLPEYPRSLLPEYVSRRISPSPILLT